MRDEGVTALVATHDPMIEEMADAVWHLEDGVVTETAVQGSARR